MSDLCEDTFADAMGDNNSCLIVDDDAYICALTSRMVRDVGLSTKTAPNAEEGLDIYNHTKPKIVLVDFHLPGMDGVELLRRIRENNPDAYVLVISSDAIEANVKIVHFCGGRGFIAKPFTKSTLLRYIMACPSIRWSDEILKTRNEKES